MNNLFFPALILFVFSACAQSTPADSTDVTDKNEVISDSKKLSFNYNLSDFYLNSDSLNLAVEFIYNSLDDTAKVAQLIMPAMGKHGQAKDVIDELLNDRLIGGILMLNGSKDEFKSWVDEYNKLTSELEFTPLLYSADAEPSLVNRKITSTTPVKKASNIKTSAEVKQVAKVISNDLNEIGINYNFSPVLDFAPNKTVGWRSFGHYPDSVVSWSNQFITETQSNNILATAKHFPGHGFVQGDTHKKLVYIDGEMKEVSNYPPVINNGVMSIMIAHIAIQNNDEYDTGGLPSSVSHNIVTGLLRDSLGFEGLIVTDALNMGGVTFVEDAALKSIQAGCDIALMPLDARKAHQQILENYKSNDDFKSQADQSIKRVIKAKICLGLYRD